MRVVVIQAREPDYADPIRVEAGEPVQTFARESEWPGWTWCEARNGKTGWVPDALLQKQGDGALVTKRYDARELAVRSGQSLEVLEERAGWYWCRADDGREGWVPVENCR
jgi:uncharacterized protein YgiM (DUF1202 family)